MGHGAERHDIHSYEQYDGQWIGFRQPVLRAARGAARRGRRRTPARPTPARCGRRTSSGSTCRGGSTPTARSASASTSSRAAARARADGRRVLRLDVRPLGARPARGAAAEGLTPLEYMRRYGAFEIAAARAPCTSSRSPPRSSPTWPSAGRRDRPGLHGRARADAPNIVPMAAPGPGRPWPTPGRRRRSTASSAAASRRRRAAGVLLLDAGRLGLAGARAARLHQEPRAPVGARPGPGGAAAHVPAADADPHPLGQRKWLDEIRTPTRSGSTRRTRPGSGCRTGDLVRVETEIGYFVVKAWRTEGIRPGVVACSHHMGRWRLTGHRQVGAGGMMATVALRQEQAGGPCGPPSTCGPSRRPIPTRARIWWSDAGVHQNLTFPVQPDPVSGMHCWHQRVTVRPPEPATRTATSPSTPPRPARSTATG